VSEEEKKAAFKNLVILRKALMEKWCSWRLSKYYEYDKALVAYVVSRCWEMYISEEGCQDRRRNPYGAYGLKKRRYFVDGTSSWWTSDEGYRFWLRISVIYMGYFDKNIPYVKGLD